MTILKLFNRITLYRLLNTVILTALFCLAYSWKPLFYSNQNHYFLHGMAQAGYGFLANDWIVKVSEAMPIFTGITFLTFTYLSSIWFYIYWLCLVGVYIHSLLGISCFLSGINYGSTLYYVLFSLLTFFHSRFLYDFFNKGLDLFPGFQAYFNEGASFLHWGVANQYVMNTYFQPSLFGVFLFLGIWFWIKGQRKLSYLCDFVAVFLHFGLFFVVFCIVGFKIVSVYKERLSQYRLFLLFNLLGVIMSSILYVVSWGSSFGPYLLFLPTIIGIAGLVLIGMLWLCYQTKPYFKALFLTFTVNGALFAYYLIQFFSHPLRSKLLPAHDYFIKTMYAFHTDPMVWFNGSVLFQLIMVITAACLVRQGFIKRLFWFGLVIIIGLSFMALVASSLENLFFNELMPWRLSVVMVPLALVVLLSWIIERLKPASHYIAVPFVGAFLIVLTVFWGVDYTRSDFREKNGSRLHRIMEWAKLSRQSGQVYVIPPNIIDFRLTTGVPILVGTKIPANKFQKDNDYFGEWKQRLTVVIAFYSQTTATLTVLKDLCEYEVSHLLIQSPHPLIDILKAYTLHHVLDWRVIDLHAIRKDLFSSG